MVNLIKFSYKFDWLFLIEHINDFLQFPCLYFLLIDHFPQTVNKPSLLFESTILKLSLLQFLFSRFDAFNSLEKMCGMEKRNASLDVQNLIIWKLHKLFWNFIDENAVTIRIDLFRCRH